MNLLPKRICSLQNGKLFVAGMVLCATAVQADQFHYANVLVGTRAVGMGGAFCGVADDASGVYYNPAGLAFALSNDIQGSANAFYSKTTTYNKTLGDDAFVEQSSGSLSPFFGGLQKLDRYVNGLVFAFGVYNVDGDLKDQDTLIENKKIGRTEIERYHRTSNARASTYYAGAAVGYRPIPSLAVGFGLNYFNSDELVQEYQYAKQLFYDANGNLTKITTLNSNIREHLVIHGMQPTLGVQTSLPGNLALGMTLKKGVIFSQKYDVISEKGIATIDANCNGKTGDGKSQMQCYQQGIVPVKSDNPVGDWPTEVRTGLAWFASPTFLMALDVSHFSAVKSGDKIFGQKYYEKEAVTNLHLGTEWYITPSLPLRIGAFTNNDARPYVDGRKSDQRDHIDYVGESIYLGWVQPNSQVAAGFTFQQGEGKAQKLGGSQVQDVKASAYSFSFSATHNL